jgi:O-antigen/teichoic acid export membrane protein
MQLMMLGLLLSPASSDLQTSPFIRSMSLVRRNLIANSLGKIWSAALSLALIPLQIHFIGIEAYGLIGVFQSLIAILTLLDLGLGSALNRQLAQYSMLPGRAQDMRNLLRTVEVVYWVIGLAVGLVVAAAAAPIADHWLQSQQLPRDRVVEALILMGAVIACQWPRALYYSGLMGLQNQVALNIMSAAVATVLNLGGILILWRISANISALLSWYVAIGIIETLLSAWLLRRALPAAPARASFTPRLLGELWRYAAGMTGITAMSIILTQVDKVILSKVLALEAFGYYSLAWRLAAGLYYLIGPVTTAFFPRFSQLAVSGDKEELARLYHKGCQLMSIVVLPATAILAFFPAELLLLWTRDPVLVTNSSTILGVLALGTALNGVMGLPAALQFAHGWTRLVFVFNTVAVLLLAPLTYVMATHYGGLGAAYVWLALNAGYVIVMLHLMHRRLLPGHLAAWLRFDFGAPLVAAFIAAGLWKLLLPVGLGVLSSLIGIVVASCCALAAAFWTTSELRPEISRNIHR